VLVQAESESDEIVQGRFLPPVQGTRIHAGKKNSVIDLDEFPRITNNNYRQALAKTPGLFLSEETTPLISLGYRGLDPHRAQFTQVLEDGIPIHADQFGYPEAYYTPPLDTVDRIEFLRGGASLMYGPQPGGALNYITHRPRLDRAFSFGTANTFGSDDYYSSFTYVDGTSGRLGYYAYYNHREGDGFRASNSAFNLNAGQLKLVLDGDTDSRWILTIESYEEEHGEPGGLTFATGPNAVNYNDNRDAPSRLYDIFELKRTFAYLTWEKDFSEETRLSMSAWGGYYSRYSSRQRGGGFGTRPTGSAANSTTVEHQEFYTQGFETRLRHDYEWLGGAHTVAGGFQAYHTDSPREDRRGKSRNARGGVLRNDSDREIWYLPFFVENRFHWGALSITPGVRFENIWQSVKENRNVDKSAAGTPLADQEDHEFVPLFGLGIEYELAPKVQIYGNVSQSYRPKIFTQAVPTGGTAIVPGDLEESKAWQYEIGFRGNPTPWALWDVSGFLLDFDDQIGSIALPGGRSTLANAGRAQHSGVEAAGELDLIGMIDAFRGAPAAATMGKDKEVAPVEESLVERFGSLSLYGNATWLDAEFVSGPLEGNTPRFAPDYLVRAGLIYRWQDRFKLAFLGTFVGDSFADDANSPERFVPASMVWDLTAEARIYKDIVSVNAGINNLFDEDYYTRIRDDGIDPAYGRNYYLGFALKF
ncbi:MAG: TonB-dependent receptor, partial [Verrucomicrobiota bacterium]|nr:TonB-dependent receptor [Verrucomicrobiota bacterium]